jgi:hypothetical protein
LVPKEPSKIARRFNAGTRAEPGHKSRRDDRKKRCLSGVPAGLDALPVFPGVETPGYFQNVPLGHGISGCPKTEMRPEDDWVPIRLLFLPPAF